MKRIILVAFGIVGMSTSVVLPKDMIKEKTRPMFGDSVKIKQTPETAAAGFAGKHGSVTGETTPSMTHVEVIGKLQSDYALSVMFNDAKHVSAWFSPDLVEFVDHGAGTEIVIGDYKAVRNADGTWDETKSRKPIAKPAKKSWWKFW